MPKCLVPLAIASLTLPSVASADLLGFYLEAKGDYFDGTGPQIERLENALGIGVETGFEILFVDLWLEAVFMGSDTYRTSFNVGFDGTFGEKTRGTVGVYGGAMLLHYPERPGASVGIDTSLLTEAENDLLVSGLMSIGKDIEDVNDEFAKYAETQAVADTLSAGPILRLRVAVDHELLPLFYAGANLDLGIHYMIGGDEVAGSFKDDAINEILAKNPEIPQEGEDALRKAVGAKKLDTDSALGFNYNFGLFVKFEI